MCVCERAVHLDAVFVTVGGASRAGILVFSEDYDVLIKENVPHARPLPPSSPTHRQLTLPHQLAALRHRDLKTHTNTHTLGHTYIGLRPRTNPQQKIPSSFQS